MQTSSVNILLHGHSFGWPPSSSRQPILCICILLVVSIIFEKTNAKHRSTETCKCSLVCDVVQKYSGRPWQVTPFISHRCFLIWGRGVRTGGSIWWTVTWDGWVCCRVLISHKLRFRFSVYAPWQENQTRMHSSRMRTARSSSRLLGVCLRACWDTHTNPHPSSVGLETPPPAETPLARPLNFPPGCGAGDL